MITNIFDYYLIIRSELNKLYNCVVCTRGWNGVILSLQALWFDAELWI